ncbi:MAG: Arc family DNA-binding protein [Rhodothermaceae bacterium]|nr:Arc family DNA-binding protein [Rhodothermaceae bacterium]
MPGITIRNLDKSLKEQLRVQAAKHGRSMEEEVRTILKVALATESASTGNLAESVRKRFGPLGGVDLPVVPREPIREPVNFE